MELRHLRYYVAVAEALHFSRAAERLHVTQPALSRQVRDLEQQLGVTLVRREGPRISLTPAGERFLVGARRVLDTAESAVAVAQGAAKQIRLGHYGHLWLSRYSDAFRSFQKSRPEFEIEPIELSPRVIFERLSRGEIEFGLVGLPPAKLPASLAARHMESVPAWIAVNSAARMAKKRRVKLEDLKNAEWIGYDEEEFPGRDELVRAAARRCGFEPNFIAHADSVASLLARVARRTAVGCVLPFSREMPHPGVALIRLSDERIQYSMTAVWRRDADLNGTLSVLAKHIASVGTASP